MSPGQPLGREGWAPGTLTLTYANKAGQTSSGCRTMPPPPRSHRGVQHQPTTAPTFIRAPFRGALRGAVGGEMGLDFLASYAYGQAKR